MLKWIPWRFFARRVARSHGFLDPIQFLARLRKFSKPSEVSEPIELLRAGVLFHARGLINTKAIQNNLDWIWPYWVERQFNPADHSFIPRAFSFSHINLTHRNWTAVGLPGVASYPIVDPRGLVTPQFDGWSIDFWLIGSDRRTLLPSKLDTAEQDLTLEKNLFVRTQLGEKNFSIQTAVSMEWIEGQAQCIVEVTTCAPDDTLLAVVIRPYNPEGISFVDSIQVAGDTRALIINRKTAVTFDRPMSRSLLSCYGEGDVFHAIGQADSGAREISCPVAMATAAAIFPTTGLSEKPLRIQVPADDEIERKSRHGPVVVSAWEEEMSALTRLQIPDPKFQRLYDLAMANLVLHSPGEVYPGPYTYKRFWYRDAAFILNALVTLGGRKRARRALLRFPDQQTRDGYFLSQDGEWDSNGEAIWIMDRYLRLTGETAPDGWLESIERGARWIINKRLPADLPESHAGLLPAGFSAEHLGPNDYYYWDDFWGVAGLRCAARMLAATQPAAAREFTAGAEDFLQTIVASFKKIPDRQARGAISASPHRRMDAGAVGSLVADFPLQLFPPGEVRLLQTAAWLMEHSFFRGGFFQNMIHSGINAYLTLHVAQVLLRAGDMRALGLIDAVADLASPTGQWPEAIHPQTLGGCMGDGQHIWAAAEWALMLRNLFVREEGDRLIIGSGIFPRWLEQRRPISLEGTATPFGSVSVHLQPEGSGFVLRVTGEWTAQIPALDVQVPGHIAQSRGAGTFILERSP